jgi:hypothetical protein
MVEVVCTSIDGVRRRQDRVDDPAPTRVSAIPRIHAPAVTGVTAGPANAVVPATIAASVTSHGVVASTPEKAAMTPNARDAVRTAVVYDAGSLTRTDTTLAATTRR